MVDIQEKKISYIYKLGNYRDFFVQIMGKKC